MPEPKTPELRPDDHAVVVGIGKYPAVGELFGPVEDAVAFRNWLVSRRGGRLPPGNVTLIRSPKALAGDRSRAVPIRAQIDAAFDRLRERETLPDGFTGRRLYVFMAGHGFDPAPDDPALLMANADYDENIGYALPARTYCDWFREAALFREIVLFMDCCRDQVRNAPVSGPPWKARPRPEAGEVRFFPGYATRSAHPAFEKPLEGAGPVRGLFTSSLIRCLKAGTPGGVTAASLAAAVRADMLRRCQDLGMPPQLPKFPFDGMDDLTFVEASDRPRPVPAVLLRLCGERGHREFELHGPRIELLARHDTGEGEWRAPLAASGLYRVGSADAVPGEPRVVGYFTYTGQGEANVRLQPE